MGGEQPSLLPGYALKGLGLKPPPLLGSLVRLGSESTYINTGIPCFLFLVSCSLFLVPSSFPLYPPFPQRIDNYDWHR